MKRTSNEFKVSHSWGLVFFLLFASQAAAQTCAPPPADMIGWWDGDAVAGTVAFDIQGGNNGTMIGGVGTIAGRVGSAFGFTAVGHQVEVPDTPDLNLESLPGATFEGWFKSSGGLDTQGGDVVVVAKHECGFANGWFFTTQQGGFIGDHHVGGFGVTGLNLNDSQFHHFAIVKHNNSYLEYIDGNLIASDFGPATGTLPVAPLQIGNITTGTCFAAKHQLNGLVDEIGIYDRALSANEILAIFDAGSSGKCKTTAPTVIVIDIKPNSDPNSINLCSNGAVPIAFFGSGTLNVLDISTEALRFAEASIKVVGKKDPHQLCSYEYVNDDYITDLVCHFVTTDIAGIDGESTSATVNGELLDGTPIEGTDSVNIVKDACN